MINISSESEGVLKHATLRRLISHSNYSVYVFDSPNSPKPHCVKLFPKSAVFDSSYLREKAIQDLSHKNISQVVESYDEISITESADEFKFSSIVTEFSNFGDLAELISANRIPQNETVVRTLFKEIIEGVEYLHSKNLAHLDIKPENIILSEDFIPKIIDFDSIVNIKNFKEISSQGTKNYRCPELKNKCCRDPIKADIFSLGIVLFALNFKTLPFNEDDEEFELEEAFLTGDECFWDMHPVCSDGEFSDEIKELIIACCKANPDDRISINGVKKSAWMRGRFYNQKELKQKLKLEV